MSKHRSANRLRRSTQKRKAEVGIGGYKGIEGCLAFHPHFSSYPHLPFSFETSTGEAGALSSIMLPAERGLMDKEPDLPPPIFKTWGRFYAVVIANTLVTYLLLVLFSAYAR